MSKKIRTGVKKNTDKFKIINFEEDLILGSMPQIAFIGNTKCTLEGKCSIVEYEDGILKISFKSGFITFLGERFNILVFSDNRIVFDGKIFSVELSC